jgi:hypothetical protein
VGGGVPRPPPPPPPAGGTVPPWIGGQVQCREGEFSSLGKSKFLSFQEAFINGVSTRKIERLARAMGIENISAGHVSEFNKELDAQVADFWTRPLDEVYPFLWIDALYQKGRVEGRKP